MQQFSNHLYSTLTIMDLSLFQFFCQLFKNKFYLTQSKKFYSILQNSANRYVFNNNSMNVFLFFLLAASVSSADNELLTLAKSHSCLKDVVFDFVKAQNCTLMLDHQKYQLAYQMTKCLFSNLRRELPQTCSDSVYSCKLEGDAWHTFTDFQTHIDNLCHFYWQMLQQERAQALISKLSQSSTQAQRVMRQNTLSSKRILLVQEQMHSNLKDSIIQQKEMTKLIESSAAHISNITRQIEKFAQNIREDISQNYATINKVLSLINGGVQQILQLQSYMKADITSINGILFFLIQFLAILFVTSFKAYQSARNSILLTLLLQILVQLTLPSFLFSWIGVKIIRITFIVAMIVLMVKNSTDGSQWQKEMKNQLNTPRLERLIAKAIHNQKQLWNERNFLEGFQYKIQRQVSQDEGKMMVAQ